MHIITAESRGSELLVEALQSLKRTQKRSFPSPRLDSARRLSRKQKNKTKGDFLDWRSAVACSSGTGTNNKKSAPQHMNNENQKKRRQMSRSGDFPRILSLLCLFACLAACQKLPFAACLNWPILRVYAFCLSNPASPPSCLGLAAEGSRSCFSALPPGGSVWRLRIIVSLVSSGVIQSCSHTFRPFPHGSSPSSVFLHPPSSIATSLLLPPYTSSPPLIIHLISAWDLLDR